jgi:hypothetical protein
VFESSTFEWQHLRHAYGPATDIPELLARARTDTRRGYTPDSTWFSLWSALCHQGDTYSASYAAVPYLVGLAELPAYRGNCDPLLLASSIEASRLAGRGPALATEMTEAYRAALQRGLILAHNGLEAALDIDSRQAFGGCVAVLRGDLDAGRALWDADDERVV